MLRIRIVIAIVSLVFLLAIFLLIRKGRLKERYSLLWLLTGGVIFVFSVWPGLRILIVNITGMYYLTALLFISFLFVVAILLHFSTVISELTERNRELTQRFAIMNLKFSELEKRYVARP